MLVACLAVFFIFVCVLNFSRARICLSVCLFVCLLVWKPLGQPREPKNRRIWLKFGILVPLVNIWGCFFIFWNFLFFGPGEEFLYPNEAKTKIAEGLKLSPVWLARYYDYFKNYYQNCTNLKQKHYRSITDAGFINDRLLWVHVWDLIKWISVQFYFVCCLYFVLYCFIQFYIVYIL